VLAPPAAVCDELARRVPARSAEPPEPYVPPVLPAPEPGGQLRSGHVFSALADRLPPDTVLFEESPSSRPEMLVRMPIRAPLGFVCPPMGGLGFAMPASIGIRMALPDRPVVAVVGDGSSLYAIQALWTAANYDVGVLFVILSNGGYAVMDRLAERQGGAPPWPRLDGIDIPGLARAFGCPAHRITEHGELIAALDEVVPGLGARREPLLLDITVAPDETFEP
jgi:benzoylformate decarboxylase